MVPRNSAARSPGTYGRITNPRSYLVDRYGARDLGIVRHRRLEVPNFPMSIFPVSNVCVPTAVARVFLYWADHGAAGVPTDRDQVFGDAFTVVKSWGFHQKHGTLPFFISGVMRELAEHYGQRPVVARGHYVWSFDRTIRPEIDAGRPLLWNIARGSYRKHTVTVTGYRVYSYRPEGSGQPARRPMIAVADSWATGTRWVDYPAFASDLRGAGIGSFNTLVLPAPTAEPPS